MSGEVVMGDGARQLDAGGSNLVGTTESGILLMHWQAVVAY
jgi:hypothetical protein